MGSFTNVDGQLHIFSDVVRSFSLTGQPAGGGQDRLPAGRPVMLTDTAVSWKSEKVAYTGCTKGRQSGVIVVSRLHVGE